MLRIDDISYSIAGRPLFERASASIPGGHKVGLVGPNGAGKTTLFKVLTGETPATEGTLTFRDRPIIQQPAFRRVRNGIGRTFQVARVFLDMTAGENIIIAIERRMRMAGEPMGPWYDFRPSRAIRNEALHRLAEVGLDREVETEARFLSHGDKKRLELALSLALQPDVLMLDEPTAGMSPPDRSETVRLLKRLKAERGFTMMMTEHDMDVVFGLADSVMVLNYGEIIARGAPEAVRADPIVREVYLGREVSHA